MEKTEKITYKFSTGLEVTGTIEEIEAVAKSLKLSVDYKTLDLKKVPRGFYPSESKGLTKISSMNEHWLRRALLKRSKDYLGEIFNPEDSIETFLKKFMLLSEDPIVVDLFSELNERR